MLIWLAPILVFGLVVFVHELGHFLAAKALGVYAPRFSIGFGPALWRRRWGETEYVLALLPLGGYVRMASRQDQATAFLEGGNEDREVPEVGGNAVPPTITGSERERDWDPNAMKPFGPKPVPDHRWFESKPLVGRLFILVAGVTMNVILTLVINVGSVAHYGRLYTPPVVDTVLEGRPAALAGLQRGDSIVAIDGSPVTEWQQLIDRVSASPGRTIALEVVRDGSRRTMSVRPEEREVQNELTGRKVRLGRVGAGPVRRFAREQIPFADAVVIGSDSTWKQARGIVDLVRGIFAGDVSTVAARRTDRDRAGVRSGRAIWARNAVRVDRAPEHQRCRAEHASGTDTRRWTDPAQRARSRKGKRLQRANA
jgi:regulator of sigma E protease